MANPYHHNIIPFALFHMARDLCGQRQPMLAVPILVAAHDSRTYFLGLRDWDHGLDLYVDVVGTSPLAGLYRAHFVPRGGAVERAAAMKVT